MSTTDSSEIGSAEITGFNYSNGFLDYEITFNFVDPDTLPGQIAQSGSSRNLYVTDETRGTEIQMIEEIPSVEGEYKINESVDMLGDAEVSFELVQTHVETWEDDGEIQIYTYEWSLIVSDVAGNPSEPDFVDIDVDNDDNAELILWDAVKNEDGTLGWVDVEVDASLTGVGYYQILEGPSTGDTVKDVTGVQSPDQRGMTFASDTNDVIVWYVHNTLENDLVVEGELRELEPGEPFPGADDESELQLTSVTANQGSGSNISVDFEIQNNVVSGSGSDIDFNANIELDQFLDHKVEGNVPPGETMMFSTTIENVESGNHEVCVWI
jgi:hypothetical protein